jgi:hypothetical protein
MNRFGWRRPLGLRWRISIAFIAGAVAFSALVGGSTYFVA